MSKTKVLKQLIKSPEILVMPGAYDALSAKIIESLGFKAVQCSGLGISASVLGKPDLGLISMSDILNQTRNIAQAVSIPAMADGDTGHGNAVNVYNTVHVFEQAGCAGINLEDQVFPKKSGYMEGKQVISLAKMVSNIKAAIAAKTDPDFVINARTDALAVYGVEEVIRRGNAYAAAGADLIYVESISRKEDLKTIIKSIDAPVSVNMSDTGKNLVCSIDELQEWGVARASYSGLVLFSAVQGIKRSLELLKKERISPVINNPDLAVTFTEFTDLVDLPFYRELEKQFVTLSE